jgi:hypothetical protein
MEGRRPDTFLRASLEARCLVLLFTSNTYSLFHRSYSWTRGPVMGEQSCRRETGFIRLHFPMHRVIFTL